MTAGLNSNVRHQNLHPANKFYTKEHQPVPQTLDKRCDNCLDSSLQNVSSLALYTIAAIAAQGFPHPAWAKSSVKTTYQPDIFALTTIEPTQMQSGQSATSATHSQALASPESIVVQEFAPESFLKAEDRGQKVEGKEQGFDEHDITSDIQVGLAVQDDQKNRGDGGDGEMGRWGEFPSHHSPITHHQSPIQEDRGGLEFSGKSELRLPTLDASELESSNQIVPIVVSARQTEENRQPRVSIDPQDDPHVNSLAVDRENKEVKEKIQSVAINPKKPCSATQQTMLAQSPNQPTQPAPCLEVNRLQEELRSLEDIDTQAQLRASPSLSIVIPTAYGAHRNTGFVSATYQERTRYSDVDDGALGIGIGLGDAEKSVGVELSYTLASFGSNRDFGSGGFNAKVHRRLPQGWAVAAGWNGLINLGDDNDFEHSVYGVVSKIIRTREDITQPFSRVAITAGIGNGQFRTEEAVDDDNGTINVFGNVAVRVAEPVSLIAEWTGQDLGVGVSIAPFKNIPLVITPALRDITGAGDGTRFVLGAGFAFKF
ncbi:MAG: hypothetical protein RIM23_26445 [Coleofasciculus sp. G3-WIS-01]|uniref:hypothetical protein n=1 Tax=Coleofasciculus sp. G3-WIS-01 TaxID=3069528 RepID=UPI0032FCEA13